MTKGVEVHNARTGAWQAPTRNDYIRAARELAAGPRRKSAGLFLAVLFLGTLVMVISGALSMVTAAILMRVMPAPLAVIVGLLLHLAIGLGVHLVTHGREQHDRSDLGWGLASAGVGVLALTILGVARARLLVEEGKPGLVAWGLSLFILLLEIVVPGLAGYVFSRVWSSWSWERDDARFFKQHAGLIETSQDPGPRWDDGIRRQAGLAERFCGELPGSTPDEEPALRAKARRAQDRCELLEEWHPARRFGETPSVVVALPQGVEAGSSPEHRVTALNGADRERIGAR